MATIRTRAYFNSLFVTGYQPTQTDYQDLFLTIPMRKETTDKAKVSAGGALDTEQGLVVLASNAQAKANTSQPSDRSIVLQAHQAPTVIHSTSPTADAIINDITSFSGLGVTIAADGTTTRNNYVVTLSTAIKSWFTSIFNTINSRLVAVESSGYSTVSTTSLAIEIGQKTFTVPTGLSYGVGTRVRARQSSDSANFMEGNVVTYSTGLLVVNVDHIGGSGTIANWSINLGGTEIYKTISSSSLAIGTGSKAFTVSAGLAYQVGVRARATSAANSANYMEGNVASYSATTLTITVDTVGGSGTLADWNINLGGGSTTSSSPTPLLTKVLEIGAFNMTSSFGAAALDVPHGLDISKIRGVTIIVRGDSLSTRFWPIEAPLAGFVGTRYDFDSTNVSINKAETGGFFDNVEFSEPAAFNRGYITIYYVV